MVNLKKSLNAGTSSDVIYGRVQPQDVVTEKYILSRILTGNEIGTSALILKSDDFYLDYHNLIYSACLNIFIDGKNVDLLSCRNELIKLEQFENVGGMTYLQELTTKYFSNNNVEDMAYLIRDLSIKRKVIQLCTEKINTAFNNSSYGFQLLAETQNSIEEIQESLFSKDTKDIKSGLTKIINRIGVEEIIGFPTGLKDLDEATNGLLQPDLIIIAAKASEGKSVFALQIAENMAASGYPGMFFSLEMKQEQIIERLVSKATGYSVTELRRSKYYDEKDGSIKQIDKELVRRLTKHYEGLPLHFHDSGLDSYLDIGAITKAEIIRKKLKWIAIDYLQLIPIPGKNETRDVLIGKVTRYLKVLAMKLEIPIILLSQVSRSKIKRDRYKLEDLRESGNIEQDADGVIFLFRPEMHGHKIYEFEEDDIEVTKQTAIIQIVKWRSGMPQDILVEFHGKTSQIKSVSKQESQIINLGDNELLPF